MVTAFLTLLVFQLLGSAVQARFGLSVPGPVIGMFMLVGFLLARQAMERGARPVVSDDLGRLARGLIAALGLLFVPAGVGVVTQFGVLRTNFVPIAVAIVGSTVLALVVTGAVMHLGTRSRKPRA